MRYTDYARWQAEVLGAADDPRSVLAEQLGYWRTQLAGLPEELALPVDHPRSEAASHRGHRLPLETSPDLHRALLATAREQGVTLFMRTGRAR